MLTRKQLDLLTFISKRIHKDGVSPSFDEMKEALGLRSKSGIHRLISALEERGFIRRLPHRARAIEILKLPDSGEAGGFVPTSIDGGLAHKQVEPAQAFAHSLEIPMMGRIAAGTPISAIAEVHNHVTVPSAMTPNSGEHYALEVKGDSMIDAGIHHGDIVVIRRQDDATNGDIVVALVEDQEATLKTLRRKNEVIELEAANPAYKTQRYHEEQVKIQGRMVGLIRTF
jgi:repressor LexA